jgi:hypothetical protein
VENVDAGFASYSIDNAVGGFHQFTNAGPFVPVNHAAKAGKCCQVIAALEDAVDCSVCSLLRVRGNVTMDVGERSQRAVRPDDVHFGMPSLFRISSLVHVMPASKSAIPSSTRSRSTTSRA